MARALARNAMRTLADTHDRVIGGASANILSGGITARRTPASSGLGRASRIGGGASGVPPPLGMELADGGSRACRHAGSSSNNSAIDDEPATMREVRGLIV